MPRCPITALRLSTEGLARHFAAKRADGRQDLRQRIMWWVWADTDDRAWFGWLSDRWPWHRRLSMEDAIARPLCWFYGHNPIRDQCGNPDHDACSWCRTSMPGLARPDRVAADQEATDAE